MKAEVQFFNSQEAAKILGVNVSTIKRWTDEGRLQCVKTPGGHRKFFLKHLAYFLEMNQDKSSKPNLFPMENEEDLRISYYVMKGDFDYLVDYVEENALMCNRERVQQVLNGLYLGQFPLHVIYDRLVTPLLRRLGDRWHNGLISITEEHFATHTVRDAIIRLQGIIRRPTKHLGIAFCLNFSDELHDIALKMVDHILEARGFKILFSGPLTVLDNADDVFSRYRPNRVYVSSTIVENIEKVQKEFDFLCENCMKYDVGLYVGGPGFDFLNISCAKLERRLLTFEETAKY